MNKDEQLLQARQILEEKGPEVALNTATANSWLHAMSWLLDVMGVNVNSRSVPNQRAPLHTAAHLGLRAVAEFLIQRGADLDAVDSMDITPLMCACGWDGKRSAAVALMLIDAGADIHYERESDHQNALTFALRGADPEVVNALRSAGAVDCTPSPEELIREHEQRRHPHLIKKGRLAFKAGEHEECIRLLEEAKELSPIDPLSDKYLDLAKRRI
jgi:ankyrin repeat protein